MTQSTAAAVVVAAHVKVGVVKMPKFYRQNKKRIDPRYFLDETIDRGDSDGDGDADLDDIQSTLDAMQGETSDTELQPPEGFMVLDPERFSFAKGPEGDAMASKIDKALRKAGHYDKRGPDPRRPNIPATLFYGEMANGNKCDGRYGFCGSDEIAQALLALPETRGLFGADERLNSAIVHALNIELGDAFEDYFQIGKDLASRLRQGDDADTYGQAIDPRAAALQRSR